MNAPRAEVKQPRLPERNSDYFRMRQERWRDPEFWLDDARDRLEGWGLHPELWQAFANPKIVGACLGDVLDLDMIRCCLADSMDDADPRLKFVFATALRRAREWQRVHDGMWAA